MKIEPHTSVPKHFYHISFLVSYIYKSPSIIRVPVHKRFCLEYPSRVKSHQILKLQLLPSHRKRERQTDNQHRHLFLVVPLLLPSPKLCPRQYGQTLCKNSRNFIARRTEKSIQFVQNDFSKCEFFQRAFSAIYIPGLNK